MIEDGAEFTTDAMLVIVDCLIRHAYITSDRDDFLELIQAMKVWQWRGFTGIYAH